MVDSKGFILFPEINIVLTLMYLVVFYQDTEL